MGESGIGIDDIMCDYITWEDLHLESIARMDDITCYDLTFNDLNQDVCDCVVLGSMI